MSSIGGYWQYTIEVLYFATSVISHEEINNWIKD